MTQSNVGDRWRENPVFACRHHPSQCSGNCKDDIKDFVADLLTSQLEEAEKELRDANIQIADCNGWIKYDDVMAILKSKKNK